MYAQDATPDSLYANRADHSANGHALRRNGRCSLAADPRNFEAAWKLARDDYWLGGHAATPARRAFLERGIDAGRAASTLMPNRPEGHFWIAANMGALAESYGIRAGLKYRGPIKDELETVLRLDPAFQSGSADRALGRWYFKVPALFGGSRKRAEELLRASLAYDPQSTATHFFLAELLIDDHRKDEARAELQKVIDAPGNPEWAAEDRDFKARSAALLPTLR